MSIEYWAMLFPHLRAGKLDLEAIYGSSSKIFISKAILTSRTILETREDGLDGEINLDLIRPKIKL